MNGEFVLLLLPALLSGAVLGLLIRRRRQLGGSAGWREVVLGNFLLLLTLLTAAFAAGEAYYRFIYDTTDSVGYTMVCRRWFQRYYVRNSIGFRDNIEYTLKAEPGKRRVTFVGDSFAAGHGVKAVDDRFANRLRAAHPEWEVHVLAALGANTGSELELLGKSIDDGYQLDQVVLVYCLNDIGDMPEWDRVLKNIDDDFKDAGWFVHHSYLVNTFYYRFKASHNPYLKNYSSFVREGYRGAGWEEQQARLKTFRDLVRSHGGRLFVVMFPLMDALGPEYPYRSAHEVLNRFWRDENVPCLDLLTVYNDIPSSKLTVNRYDAHPNEYAHQLAAERIDEFLKPRMPAGGVKNR